AKKGGFRLAQIHTASAQDGHRYSDDPDPARPSFAASTIDRAGCVWLFCGPQSCPDFLRNAAFVLGLSLARRCVTLSQPRPTRRRQVRPQTAQRRAAPFALSARCTSRDGVGRERIELVRREEEENADLFGDGAVADRWRSAG